MPSNLHNGAHRNYRLRTSSMNTLGSFLPWPLCW